MTEEELAEKWVEKKISLGTSMYNPQIEHYCKQAFLAGLKAGKPKWHKVADRDLPKNNTQVLVLLENKRMKISIFMENKFTVWNKDYSTYTKLYNVIAWKEIELPKEE
jgi:hypothetical protein